MVAIVPWVKGVSACMSVHLEARQSHRNNHPIGVHGKAGIVARQADNPQRVGMRQLCRVVLQQTVGAAPDRRAVGGDAAVVDQRLNFRVGIASLNKAIERERLHRPVSICTDKAPTYREVIREISHEYDPHFDYIIHIDKKYRNNRVESVHAALKRLPGCRQSFRSLRSQRQPCKGWKQSEQSRTDTSRHNNPAFEERSRSSTKCLVWQIYVSLR